ncbi:MAG: hypothetical protein BWX83_01246 [Candidatus Cloacimonetes bacterium ADurb.Bin117]|nr:MAG: hypothetical protein BWX83_01246 [Candidatus Cloacimonetes bacterium ADurb.Bin117]
MGGLQLRQVFLVKLVSNGNVHVIGRDGADELVGKVIHANTIEVALVDSWRFAVFGGLGIREAGIEAFVGEHSGGLHVQDLDVHTQIVSAGAGVFQHLVFHIILVLFGNCFRVHVLFVLVAGDPAHHQRGGADEFTQLRSGFLVHEAAPGEIVFLKYGLKVLAVEHGFEILAFQESGGEGVADVLGAEPLMGRAPDVAHGDGIVVIKVHLSRTHDGHVHALGGASSQEQRQQYR